MPGKLTLRKMFVLIWSVLMMVLKVVFSWKWTPKMVIWPIAGYTVLQYTIPYWGASQWYEVLFYHLGALPIAAMAFDLWEELHQTIPSWATPAGLRPVVKQQPKLHKVLMKRAWLPKLVIIPLASVKVFEWMFMSTNVYPFLGVALLVAIIVEVMVEAFQQEAINGR